MRPIRYIVAFAPGGVNDILARIIGQKLTESWGQPVIVDNRPGAGGNLVAEIAARSAPDGYTILNISTAHTIAQTLYSKLNYSLERDLAPMVVLGSSPLIMAIYPAMPVRHGFRSDGRHARGVRAPDPHRGRSLRQGGAGLGSEGGVNQYPS